MTEAEHTEHQTGRPASHVSRGHRPSMLQHLLDESTSKQRRSRKSRATWPDSKPMCGPTSHASPSDPGTRAASSLRGCISAQSRKRLRCRPGTLSHLARTPAYRCKDLACAPQRCWDSDGLPPARLHAPRSRKGLGSRPGPQSHMARQDAHLRTDDQCVARDPRTQTASRLRGCLLPEAARARVWPWDPGAHGQNASRLCSDLACVASDLGPLGTFRLRGCMLP